MIKPFVTMLCVLQIAGCATTQYDYKKKTSLEDKIIAIGKLENDKNNIVFTGEKYTYIAEVGGEQVFDIIQNTKVEHRSLETDLPIEFEMINETDFNTRLKIRYDVPSSKIDQNTLKKLEDIGFTSTSPKCKTENAVKYCNYPLAVISLKGKVYTKDTSSIPHLLKEPYPIIITQRIYKDESTFAYKAGSTLKNIAIAPLVVVGVVLYIPVIITAAVLSAGDSEAWK